ncbi:aminotransferase-like domain-containing protein [Inhella proteolytica]|uniref:PLP-dependent aminotransferase family protein n=1 Tax=Inhella proteolytica TaxID=2795029 RepID=A0A931J0V5_9BURK|nr:PLP-dependent aminotransferase family protein [Inhella proteolytica]MBH9577416.1 PLP-dependent aminotransferase family protein [Inhella proteolytica]
MTNTVGLAEGLAADLAQRIDQRLLLPGARLPSVREAARLHGLSPYTVVAAYDRLQAQGLVEARRQRGFYVRDAKPAPRPAPTGTARAASGPAPFDAMTLIRNLLRSEHQDSPAHGTLPQSWLDAAPLRQALRAALAPGQEGLLLRYADPAGDPELRQVLAQRLAEIGIASDAEQILTTVGATQALDLIAHELTQPGDAVLVDEPGWPIEYARLVLAGLRLLPVRRGAQGPDLEQMAQLIREHRPRLYVTVSVLHNPTGHCLNLAQAYEVLRLCEGGEVLIVEDDTYAAFAPAHSPRLAALDGLRRTLYVSGFAKVLGAGLRVGYVTGRPDLIARLGERKLVHELCTSALLERALAGVLARGALRRQVERVQQRLEAARARCARLAGQHGFAFAAPPQGLFGWLDTGVDSERLTQRMLLEGFACAPELLFSPSRRSGPHIRVNFACSQDAKFWAALARTRASLA